MDPGVSADLIDPVAEYDRDEGLAIIGGFVYRGSQIPELEGHYVFGDFGQFNGSASRLFYLDGDDVIKEFSMADDTLQSISMTGIGIDNDGELYIMGNSTGTPFGSTGRVLRWIRQLQTVNRTVTVPLMEGMTILLMVGMTAMLITTMKIVVEAVVAAPALRCWV